MFVIRRRSRRDRRDVGSVARARTSGARRTRQARVVCATPAAPARGWHAKDVPPQPRAARSRTRSRIALDVATLVVDSRGDALFVQVLRPVPNGGFEAVCGAAARADAETARSPRLARRRSQREGDR